MYLNKSKQLYAGTDMRTDRQIESCRACVKGGHTGNMTVITCDVSEWIRRSQLLQAWSTRHPVRCMRRQWPTSTGD